MADVLPFDGKEELPQTLGEKMLPKFKPLLDELAAGGYGFFVLLTKQHEVSTRFTNYPPEGQIVLLERTKFGLMMQDLMEADEAAAKAQEAENERPLM
jgi:hypothetical protein